MSSSEGIFFGRGEVRTASMSAPLMLLFSGAVAIIVVNLFACQPLAPLLAPELGLRPEAASLVATLTMLGYAAGLFFLVPLVDLFENRRLIGLTLAASVAALGVAALAPSATIFLAASFAVGLTASVIQMLVPLAALLAPERERGRVVGNVMSGLMLGILLSRPIGSLVADTLGWRWLYGVSALAVALVGVVLHPALPVHRPATPPRYAHLVLSLWTLLRQEQVLRRRALYAALCMGVFSAFWTVVALRLVEAPFALDQRGLALFGLAGAAGAVSAPIAGRLGDRGWTRHGTVAAHLMMLAAMLLAAVAGSGGLGFSPSSSRSAALMLLALSAILLDFGGVADQALGRRAINLLRPEARGRLNGLFTGTFFIGGALGSALAGVAWAQAGWSGTCAVGAAFAVAAVLLDLSGRAGVP